jgi:hypothetical protein
MELKLLSGKMSVSSDPLRAEPSPEGMFPSSQLDIP